MGLKKRFFALLNIVRADHMQRALEYTDEATKKVQKKAEVREEKKKTDKQGGESMVKINEKKEKETEEKGGNLAVKSDAEILELGSSTAKVHNSSVSSESSSLKPNNSFVASECCTVSNDSSVTSESLPLKPNDSLLMQMSSTVKINDNFSTLESSIIQPDDSSVTSDSICPMSPILEGESYASHSRGEFNNSAESTPVVSDTDIPKVTPQKTSTIGTQERSRRRGKCRDSRELSGIKVKYTKVYGESDAAYKNDTTPRGLVFTCNFSEFVNRNYSQRKGSEVDYQNMLHLFQQMGYGGARDGKYRLNGNISKSTFMETLRAFSQDSRHKFLSSCVIIIMSHGLGPKAFVTSDGKEVDLMEVYTMFDNINCQLLRGKPKIFILQFCRNNAGLASTSNTSLQGNLPLSNKSFNDIIRQIVQEELRKILSDQFREEMPSSLLRERHLSEPSTLPGRLPGRIESSEFYSAFYESDSHQIEAQPSPDGLQRYSDMYSIFSTATGELSHRDTRKGSLLIQAICHVFAENAYQDDIDNLVRKVSTYMCKTLQKDDPITVPRVTCERTNNGLDKKFYFNPVEVHRCRHVTI